MYVSELTSSSRTFTLKEPSPERCGVLSGLPQHAFASSRSPVQWFLPLRDGRNWICEPITFHIVSPEICIFRFVASGLCNSLWFWPHCRLLGQDYPNRLSPQEGKQSRICLARAQRSGTVRCINFVQFPSPCDLLQTLQSCIFISQSHFVLSKNMHRCLYLAPVDAVVLGAIFPASLCTVSEAIFWDSASCVNNVHNMTTDSLLPFSKIHRWYPANIVSGSLRFNLV